MVKKLHNRHKLVNLNFTFIPSYMKTGLILFFLVSAYASNSQNAAYLYRNNYFRLGVDIDYRIMFSSNYSPDNIYYWKALQTVGFGVQYNFYQKDNLNFRTSALYVIGNIREQIKENDIDGDIIKTGNIEQVRLVTLPIELEYYLKLNDKFFISPFTGFELLVNTLKPYSYAGSTTIEIQNGENTTKYSTVIRTNYEIPVYYGFNFGCSISYELQPVLIKFNVKYHYQFGDYLYRGLTRIEKNGFYTASKHQITGEYLGFGITIIPRKNLSR